jgi:hypothetical protein
VSATPKVQRDLQPDRRHVVVSEAGAGLLVHVLNVEIGNVILMSHQERLFALGLQRFRFFECRRSG